MKLIKLIIVAVVMLCSLYPILELSRCIYEYNIKLILSAEANSIPIIWSSGGAYTIEDFYFELAFMWGLYIIIPVIIWLGLNLAYKEGKKGVVK